MKAGESISFTVVRQSGDLDLELALYAPDGTLVVANDADASGKGSIPAQTVAVPGQYILIVTRKGGVTGQTVGEYRLQLKRGG